MIEKLDMKTPDFTTENIAQIAALFPNCVTETKDTKGNIKKAIDFDLLKQELSEYIVDGVKERYSLNWPGKKEALVTANKPINKTLRPDVEDSVNFDTTQNLYIEGDNLEALKLLQESYLNKIKIIYIDPPYNTGEDFIYNDNFTSDKDEELESSGQKSEEGRLVANSDSSGRYHSDWMSMMYSRLKLARNLLQEDGSMFISIDDNEVFNLKKMCDEIFGEDNTKIIAVKMSEASGLKMGGVIKSGSIPKLKEYVIVIKMNGINNLYFDKVSKGKWDTEYNIFLANFTKEDRSLIKKIQSQDTVSQKDIDILDELAKKIELKSVSDAIKENQVDKDSKIEWLFDNAWRICQSTTSASVLKLAIEKKQYCNQNLFFVKSSTGLVYFVKATFSDESKKPRLQLIFADDNLEVHPGDFWAHIKTTGLDNEGGVPYKNGKKPLSLLKALIKSNIGEDKDSIVLDFFSGSASTGHAVMQLNNDENYDLKFIMTQLNENLDETLKKVTGDTKKEVQETIDFLDSIEKPHLLTELGKERIKRSGKKIVENNKQVNLDIGFRVLKIDSSNMNDVYYSPDEITQESLFDVTVDNIKPDRKPLDLLFQVLLDSGVDLTLPIVKKEILGKEVYFVDENVLVACFENSIDEALVTQIAKMEDILKVVFKDSSFQSDDMRINVEQIFKQYSPDTQLKVI
jgi:adenine-specific DNA-methyltransferase